MATIQSIQDILQTYQKVYGAEALSAQLQVFLKAPAAPSEPAKPSAPSVPSASPLSSLAAQDLRDIWADLTGRKKGLKSSGKFSKKELLIAEIERLRSSAPVPSVPSVPSAPAAKVVVVAEAVPEAVKKERQIGEGTKTWNLFTTQVAALCKALRAESGQKMTPGLHLKVAGALKKKGITEATEEAVREVMETFSEQSDSASVASAAPSAASSEKKRGRPKMSEEEKEAKKAAKKEARKAEKAAEKEARKAEKAAAKSAKSAKKSPAEIPLPPSDDEEEEQTYTEIELGGQAYFWDEKTELFYQRDDETGALLQCGTFDGESFSFA